MADSPARLSTLDDEVTEILSKYLKRIQNVISPADAVFEQQFGSETRTIYVECKDSSTPIEPSDIELTAQKYTKILNNNPLSHLLIVTREGVNTTNYTPPHHRQVNHLTIELLHSVYGRMGTHHFTDDWGAKIAPFDQSDIGFKFNVEDEHLRITSTPNDSDVSAANDSLTQHLHVEVRRKTVAIKLFCHRLHNQSPWDALVFAIDSFGSAVDVDTADIPAKIGQVYSLVLELGSFLELDDTLRANIDSNFNPLEPEVRRALSDLIRTTAPWVRRFPTARQLDDETGSFLTNPSLFTPAKAVVSHAGAAGLLIEPDARSLNRLIAAGERGQTISAKARTRSTTSAKNLVMSISAAAFTFYSGAIASDFSTHSRLVHKISHFANLAEDSVLDLFSDAPPDLKHAVTGMMFDLKSYILPSESAVVPSHRAVGDGNSDKVTKMRGPEILVRTLSHRAHPDQHGNPWQYHSRSDHHSKVACWGIVFDLMRTCALLRRHVESGQVSFGINHEMRDFVHDRKKNLDLVLCTPSSAPNSAAPLTLGGLAESYGISLTEAEAGELSSLPMLTRTPVGSVLVALEAKACMTAHQRALPRLYDELNSSHVTVHGATDQAIAAGFAMINISERYLSPDLNKKNRLTDPEWSTHNQPRDASLAVDKVRQLPRRAKPGEVGYDAFGIVVVDFPNDGSPVKLVTTPPAPPPGDIYHYASMIDRLAHIYATRFKEL